MASNGRAAIEAKVYRASAHRNGRPAQLGSGRPGSGGTAGTGGSVDAEDIGATIVSDGELLAESAGADRNAGSGREVLDTSVLAGRTVLIVDDDVRNVFALTSALELHGLSVLYADNGATGITLLQANPQVDLVLMDVMMPDMDGNETTAAIRGMHGLADLPILFLTAKAMPGDRDKSIAAGASDYITKPVDLDRLLRLMAGWCTPVADPAQDAPGSPA
jgi:CheY-like chemotaxis protein